MGDSIAIVMVLDFLYNNFKTITASILECSKKTINKIQLILIFFKNLIYQQVSYRCYNRFGNNVESQKCWYKVKNNYQK